MVAQRRLGPGFLAKLVTGAPQTTYAFSRYSVASLRGNHNETLVAAALDRCLLRRYRDTAPACRSGAGCNRVRGPREARAAANEDHARGARAGRRLQGARCAGAGPRLAAD